MMRKFTLGLLGVSALALMPSTASAECGAVSITEMDWASSAVVTGVAKFLMEVGYGCTVTTVPSSTNPALLSVAETGEPDLVTEMWVNSAPAYAEMSESGAIVTLTDVLSDGGVEGWWIPTYLAEAHPELTTIDGIMANPELIGGRFHNCPDGWGCRTVNDANIAALGMRDIDGLEIFDHGSGETLATSIAAAYADESPWFGYYWAPTSVLGKYPMVMVDVGEFDADAHACNADAECSDLGVSPYPTALVFTLATADFADREPAIAELMTNVSFTNSLMGELLAWQEDNAASTEEVAVYFLSNYSDVWSTWLSEDAAGNLAGLIQ